MNIEKGARRLEKGLLWGFIKYPAFDIAEEYYRAAIEYTIKKDSKNAIRCYSIAAKYYYKEEMLSSVSDCNVHCYNLSKNVQYLHEAYKNNKNKALIIDLYCTHYCSTEDYLILADILKKIYYDMDDNSIMKFTKKKVLYNWILAMIIGDEPIIEETLEKIPECIYTQLIVNSFNNNKEINFCYTNNMNVSLVTKFNEKVRQKKNTELLKIVLGSTTPQKTDREVNAKLSESDLSDLL